MKILVLEARTMKSLTTSDRVMLLIAMVAYLRHNGPTHVHELAEHFDVTDSVIRDLATFLGTAGIPGETLTYQHQDLYDLDWDALEQEDLVRMVQFVALEDSPRFSSAETAAILAGLHTLRDMLPNDLQQHAESALSKLSQISPAEEITLTVSAEVVSNELTTVAEGISSHRQLSFLYRDATGAQTQRRVDPLVLRQSAGSWYLQAHCHDRHDRRTFLVDRMRSVHLLEETAVNVSSSSDDELFMTPQDASITATALVRQTSLHRILDFMPRVISDPQTGWVLVEVDLHHPAVAIRLVQACPGDIVVQTPDAARHAVHTWAEEALSNYDS